MGLYSSSSWWFLLIICAQTRHLTTSGGIELGVNVLTMSYWPPYTPAEVVLPNQVSCKDGPLSTMCSSALDFLLSLIIYCPPPLPPPSPPLDGTIFGQFQEVLHQQTQWQEAAVAALTGPVRPQVLLPSWREGAASVPLPDPRPPPLQLHRRPHIHRYQRADWDWYVWYLHL